MKVAISATGPTLDAGIDPRFGRCSCFVVVETSDLSFEAVQNPAGAHGGGAGIRSAQLVAQTGAKAVLTGSCGPNAHQTLTAAGIEIYLGCVGTVSKAVECYRAGELCVSHAPDVAEHAGMGGRKP